MPEYHVEFGSALLKAAKSVAKEGDQNIHSDRVVLYLSLLSIEISLKALLEQAGYHVKEISSHSHNLKSLLAEFGNLTVEQDILGRRGTPVPATQLRATPIYYGEAEATIGTIIEQIDPKPSTYPNEIRYGQALKHFPTEVIVQVADKVAHFANDHFATIRRKN